MIANREALDLIYTFFFFQLPFLSLNFFISLFCALPYPVFHHFKGKSIWVWAQSKEGDDFHVLFFEKGKKRERVEKSIYVAGGEINVGCRNFDRRYSSVCSCNTEIWCTRRECADIKSERESLLCADGFLCFFFCYWKFIICFRIICCLCTLYTHTFVCPRNENSLSI